MNSHVLLLVIVGLALCQTKPLEYNYIDNLGQQTYLVPSLRSGVIQSDDGVEVVNVGYVNNPNLVDYQTNYQQVIPQYQNVVPQPQEIYQNVVPSNQYVVQSQPQLVAVQNQPQVIAANQPQIVAVPAQNQVVAAQQSVPIATSAQVVKAATPVKERQIPIVQHGDSTVPLTGPSKPDSAVILQGKNGETQVHRVPASFIEHFPEGSYIAPGTGLRGKWFSDDKEKHFDDGNYKGEYFHHFYN